ncbi:MAG: TlpA family protein disulfide reductase [Saprospiraceae bacterium]|nr:TlpA family protein disulfide reductase [Saprospiraceae bacterium]
MQTGDIVTSWELDSIFDEAVPEIEFFRGRPLLILFFNLGCPGCKGRALPFANLLVFEGKDLSVVGIHSRFEGKRHLLSELKEAKKEFHIRFPYFQDRNDKNTFEKYQAGGTPHWILIDKNGNLAYSIFGSSPNNALLKLELKISELLQ